MTAGLLLVHGYNESELEFCDLEKNINRKFDIIEGAGSHELADTLKSRVQIKYDVVILWTYNHRHHLFS